MQLSGQPRYQGSLLPVPGNEVVLSLFTGCVKSVKKLRCEMSYQDYHEKSHFYNEDCFCSWSRFESEGWVLEVVKGLYNIARKFA